MKFVLQTKQQKMDNSFSSLLAILFFSMLGLHAQGQYFWVGGSGNWSDFENHWATTSGGNSFHDMEPTFEDDVYFDENSFSSSDQQVTFDAAQSNCYSFDCSEVLFTPTFFSTETLRIYGSAIFSENVIYDVDEIVVFYGDDGTTFTSNGALFDNSTIEFNNNSGNGILDLMDDLSCSDFRFYKGIFNTNGHALNIGYDLYVGGSGMKVFNLGDSEITCVQWRTNADNLTINPGTSHIYLNDMDADIDGNGPFNYNNLTFLDGNGELYGNANYNTINANGTAGYSLEFEPETTITCNDFILEATRNNDVYMSQGYEFDNPVNLVVSSGSIDLSYIRMVGIEASGGATFNVNPGVDLGNNSGWTFTDIVPLNYYWVGDGGNWDDLSHWSSTSGGEPNYGNLSSRYDNVIFDSNSFSSDDQTVILNYDAEMKSLDFSEMTNQLSLTTFGGGDDLYLYGDLNISDLVNKDMNRIYFYATGEVDVSLGSQGILNWVVFENGAEYNLQADLSCSNLRSSGSAIHTNDFDINCTYDFILQNESELTYEFGSSEIYCRDFDISNWNINLNAGTSIIHARREFIGADHAFNHVILEDGELENIIEDDNTFETLEFSAGITCEIESGSIQSATNILINGTGALPISIRSSEVGEQATLSKNSGTVDATFVSLQDNNATGGATFNALQAVDFGNNTGWNITELQPNDFYWVGGSGNWTDYNNHWATTSGGSTFYNYIPGVLDNVYFDENSFNSTNQEVTIDIENINCNTMDWTGVTNNPHFSGIGRTLNVFGSLVFDNDMTADLSIYNFLGEGVNSIYPGFENSPGIDTEINFLAVGVWNINGDITTDIINHEAGTINTNDFYINLTEDFKFFDDGEKTLNLGFSTLNIRDFEYESALGSNLTIEGGNSNIICRRIFNPYPNGGDNILITLNNLHFELDTNPNKYIEEVILNTLTLDPGVILRINSDDTITVNQLIAEGTGSSLIQIMSIFEGTQATISQENGTVDGEYLLLQDLIGSGGATFYANNSIDNGNVDGWIFTGQAQSITFSTIDNVLENIGSFMLDATATSGLPVSFSVTDGPATIEGNMITITGPGTVDVEAYQIGDDLYNPAAPIELEFCSNPLQPIVTGDQENLFITLTSSSETGNYWYMDGELFGQFDQSFQTSENGAYTVQVNIQGCISEISETYLVLDLSLNEVNNNQSILTYPNPTSGLLYFTLSTNEKVTTKLYNSLGELVFSKEEIELSNNKKVLDISTLDSGIYFLLIQSKSEKYSSKIYKEN